MKINKYNRAFARRVWRQSFENPITWKSTRQVGRSGSFRNFLKGN